MQARPWVGAQTAGGRATHPHGRVTLQSLGCRSQSTEHSTGLLISLNASCLCNKGSSLRGQKPRTAGDKSSHTPKGGLTDRCPPFAPNPVTC